MEKFKLIAGIDISMNTLDVQWRRTGSSDPATHQKVANSAKGIQELFSLLLSIEPESQQILICCENTGTYMHKLSTAAQSLQCVFWPVHPMIIKNYQIDLQRAKNDKADAGKILEFASNHQARAKDYRHPDWHLSQLKDLFRMKKQLTRILTQFKNFKHAHKQQAFCNVFSTSVYDQVVDLLKQYIQKCELEIKATIKQSPNINNIYNILRSIPGIGPVTAVHMIIVSEGFEKISIYKAFACFIGIAPFEYSSGTSVRKRTQISQMSYKPLKADLHQGAMSVIRPGQLYYEYYQNMKALNKHHLWIINSVSNKIAKLAFDLVTKQILFDKDFYLTNKKSLRNNLQMS